MGSTMPAVWRPQRCCPPLSRPSRQCPPRPPLCCLSTQIAHHYHVKERELAHLNRHIHDLHWIHPGTVVNLPKHVCGEPACGAGPCGAAEEAVVRAWAGESCPVRCAASTVRLASSPQPAPSAEKKEKKERPDRKHRPERKHRPDRKDRKDEDKHRPARHCTCERPGGGGAGEAGPPRALSWLAPLRNAHPRPPSHPTSTDTVQHGDYLYKIAQHYHTDVHALLALNPKIHNPNLIHTGDRINVPCRN